MVQYMAFHLGFHCLPMYPFWGSGFQWIKSGMVELTAHKYRLQILFKYMWSMCLGRISYSLAILSQ